MSREEVQKTVRELVEHYDKTGTFGNHTQVVEGMDERFTLRDYYRAFKSVPRLRKDLLLGLCWGLATSWKKRREPGYTLRYDPKRKYTFFHRSVCDLLIWECVTGAYKHFGMELPPDVKARIEDSVRLFLRNGREVDFEGGKLTVFSSYPNHDHLLPLDSPAYSHFVSWDAGVAENDTTCITLGALIRLIKDLRMPMETLERPVPQMRLHLQLLKEHIYGEGKHGKGYLSYDSGVTAEDTGVLTWTFDEHNELDPTSNINILNFLFLLPSFDYEELRPEICFLTKKILRFLRNHVDAGTFFNPRLQQYYPVPSTYFFWQRFLKNRDLLDEGTLQELDPENTVNDVNLFLKENAGRFFAEGHGLNSNDFALASPFLVKNGLLREWEPGFWAGREGVLTRSRMDFYEIFHQLYPAKVICLTECIPIAGRLDFLVERDRFEKRARS